MVSRLVKMMLVIDWLMKAVVRIVRMLMVDSDGGDNKDGGEVDDEGKSDEVGETDNGKDGDNKGESVGVVDAGEYEGN